MRYFPDVWIILKYSGKGVPNNLFYKLLSSNYGNFLEDDTWKLNSGITDIVYKEGKYEIKGYSGSIYFCSEDTERMNPTMASVFNKLINEAKNTGILVELVPMKKVLPNFN